MLKVVNLLNQFLKRNFPPSLQHSLKKINQAVSESGETLLDPPSTMADEALKEEAKAKARAEAQEKIDEALSCSWIDDLKEGPCGAPFVEAFGCFVKSQQPIFEVSSGSYKYHLCYSDNSLPSATEREVSWPPMIFKRPSFIHIRLTLTFLLSPCHSSRKRSTGGNGLYRRLRQAEGVHGQAPRAVRGLCEGF